MTYDIIQAHDSFLGKKCNKLKRVQPSYELCKRGDLIPYNPKYKRLLSGSCHDLTNLDYERFF